MTKPASALVLLFYLLLSLALRLPAFRASVVDWDESLYFLMAEQWRAGHLPYTALWDNKPVGIYAIFALFQMLCGDVPAAMRWAAIVATAMTAWLVAGLVEKLGGGRVAGIGGGIAYLAASATGAGLAANTELFFATFVCLALWIALDERPVTSQRALLAGLVLGLGFMVKYVVLFEGGAVLLALIWGSGARRAAVDTMAFGAGLAAPLLAAFALYAAAGQADLFLDASLAANLRRVAQPFSPGAAWDSFAVIAAAQPGLYAAAVAALGYCVIRLSLWRGGAPEKTPLLLSIWALGAIVGVAAAKSFFQHYFLQLLPVAAVAGFWLAGHLAGRLKGKACPPVLASTALAFAVLAPTLPAMGVTVADDFQQIGGGRDVFAPDDAPSRIAADLAPELARHPGATIYVFDYQPILYALDHVSPPTRYAFPSFLLEKSLAPVTGIDAAAEFRAIVARQPLFLIRSNLRHPVAARDRMDIYSSFAGLVPNYYAVWRVYDAATVYRRVATAP